MRFSVTKTISERAKQTLAILLMVLVPGLTFMHVLAHKRQRKEVKRFLERTVGMEMAEDLFLPATAEYEHLKKGSEIVLGGNKYDLLQVTKVPGGYRVKAFNDRLEKALENQIAQQTENGDGGSSKAKSVWFEKVQWAVDGVSVRLGDPLKGFGHISVAKVAALPTRFLEVSVPPPQG